MVVPIPVRVATLVLDESGSDKVCTRNRR
jgi:hypothetical protein